MTTQAALAGRNVLRQVIEATGKKYDSSFSLSGGGVNSYDVTPEAGTRVRTLVKKTHPFLQRVVYRKYPDPIYKHKYYDVSGPLHQRKGVGSQIVRETDGWTQRQFETHKFQLRFKITWEKADAWRHEAGDLRAKLVSKYLRAAGNEIATIGLRGINAAADTTDILQLERGFKQILREVHGSNVVSTIVPGGSVILIGPKPRAMRVDSAAAASKDGGAKTGIPCMAHGFPVGGMVYFEGTTKHNGPYLVEPESTANEIVIAKAYEAETFTDSAAAVMYPDYPNLHTLVLDLIKLIPEDIEGARDGLVVVVDNQLFGHEEFKAYAAINPATPSEYAHVQQLLVGLGGLDSYKLYGMDMGDIWICPWSIMEFREQSDTRRREFKEDFDLEATIWKEYFNMHTFLDEVINFVAAENVMPLLPGTLDR